MPIPTGPSLPLDMQDEGPDVRRGHGWATTLRRTVQPLRGARENAHDALLECQARSAHRREAAAGLVPEPRRPPD